MRATPFCAFASSLRVEARVKEGPERYNGARTMQVLKYYRYQDRSIPAMITFKKMRTMTMRYDAEREMLKVSVPRFTTGSKVDAFVMEHLPRLLARVKKKVSPYDGKYLYVLGKPVEVGEIDEEEIEKILKKAALEYLPSRVAELEALMGVNPPYKVRVRKMKRTLGSNSRKTHTLTFQVRLFAFTPEIVDSVIVHELAHHFAFDHSDKFYAVVYRYCPDYATLRKKLIHDRYAG